MNQESFSFALKDCQELNMNNTTNTQDTGIGSLETKILISFYVIIIILTILGNTLVCVAIYVDTRMRSPTNWFIASLAVSDLFYGLAGLPFRIATTVSQNPSPEICYVWIWVDMVCAAASMANLAVISVDRYLKITKPFSYHRNMTKRRSFLSVGGVWVYATILATLSIIKWPEAGGVTADGFCKNDNKVFYTVANIVAFLAPLTVLVVSYSMILRTAWIQFKKMTDSLVTTSSSSEDRHKQRSVMRDFKATKTLAVVLGTFTVCWAPFFIMFTIHQYDEEYLMHIPIDLANGIIYTFYFILPNINSACNPVIYAYFNSEFRHAFKKLMFSACDKRFREYGGRANRKSSMTSFFQSTFVRRGSPQTPPGDGNHNHNHHSSKEDEKAFLNGDTLVTQV